MDVYTTQKLCVLHVYLPARILKDDLFIVTTKQSLK